MSKPGPKINLGEHCFIAGGTGSGKSFLADVYSAGITDVVIHDTKGMFEWSHIDLENVEIIEELEKLPKAKKRQIIYRPRFEELNMEYYEEFYKWIYFRQNCAVVVDELMEVCPNPQTMPFYYKGILTRGRQRSTSVMSLTQRPKTIPQVAISESKHIFIFRLNLEQDRQKIVDVTGHSEFLTKPGKFEFWYLDTFKDGATPIKAKLIEKT